MLAVEFSGTLMGVLARVFFPCMRKLRSGKAVHFGKRYLHSAIGFVIAGMVVTVLTFPKFDVVLSGQGADASVRLFAVAFGFGFGCSAP